MYIENLCCVAKGLQKAVEKISPVVWVYTAGEDEEAVDIFNQNFFYDVVEKLRTDDLLLIYTPLESTKIYWAKIIKIHNNITLEAISTGGGAGGDVISVNGKNGVVVLSATDILNQAQLDAVNSGITAEKVAEYDHNLEEFEQLNGEVATLEAEQQTIKSDLGDLGDQVIENNNAIATKNDIFQLDVFPDLNTPNVPNPFQYIGETIGSAIKGHIYEKVETDFTQWERNDNQTYIVTMGGALVGDGVYQADGKTMIGTITDISDDAMTYTDTDGQSVSTTYHSVFHTSGFEEVYDFGGGAKDITYSNTESGLNASNVQDAIDEVSISLQHNWLKGKTINFLGDSITRGHISNSEAMERPYPTNVATILNCTCNNYSVSGSTLVNDTAPYSHLSFIDRMIDMDKTASVNVVMGGTNDYAHSDILLGNFSDTGSSTIYGALKTIAEYLIAEFPNAINIFCAPIRYGSSTNNGRYSMEELVYAIKSVAKHYGFVFIDTYHNLPSWMPSNATLLARYGVNGTDTTHPNQLFSDTVFGPYMASSILRMDGGNALTPKDEIYVRDILDLTTYADSTWLTGKIKGWVEDGVLHAYFYNATMLKGGGGARFNDDASWNNAEYKLNVPKTSVMGWQPIHIFNSNKIAGFIYAGNGVNAFSWQYNAEYDGTFPTAVFFTSIDLPLDR